MAHQSTRGLQGFSDNSLTVRSPLKHTTGPSCEIWVVRMSLMGTLVGEVNQRVAKIPASLMTSNFQKLDVRLVFLCHCIVNV